MNLRSRVLIIYLCIAVLVLILIGVLLPTTLHKQNLNTFSRDSINQVRHIDFALSNLINEARYDVHDLSLNKDVRSYDDTGFTNFLNASEETFTYSIGNQEQAIIDVMKAYQTSHPYVSSVYMGRENGGFVRSYPRARPTAYDPRKRPWYILGKDHPGVVSVTDPYQAVTTQDTNIGIVTPLQYPNGTVYGVVGADITLVNLATYISQFDIGHEGEMILVDNHGTILAARNSSSLFSPVRSIVGDQETAFQSTAEGILVLQGSYLIYYTSPELGWKIGVITPFSAVEQRTNESIMGVLLFVIIALVLLSAITLVALEKTIIRPLSNLTDVSRRISETGDLDQEIATEGSGEIGELSRSFKAMVEKIRAEEMARKQAYSELARYRDNLEETIVERTRELAAAKDAAESADRLKSAFLATMSHELRTPLNSIIGFSGILREELAGPLNDEQKKQLGMVSSSAGHLLSLINDVLDISKIEAGQLRVADEPVDLRVVIQKMYQTIRPLAEKKSLSLELRIAPDVKTVRGDSRRIEQILLNLLSNAIKFTDSGKIQVESCVKDDTVLVRVIDNGIGIREEDLDRLFKPFSQVDTGMTRQYDGTGLGLSITRRLATLMGGDVSVESVYGKGSTFTVTLPRMEEEK